MWGVSDRRTIAVLPDHVIDQIAAGEVVDRPASVVKELIDNALDAGARTITVEAEQGGRALLRVIDDGAGLSPDDLAMAVRRHATSKIRSVTDLDALQTMGFRGEALSSIASVAHFEMTSRVAAAQAATRMTLRPGSPAEFSAAGAPVGTTIVVGELFSNVPARQKFMKGAATEAAHITDTVTRAAMAHPHIHFRLRHDGRVALDVPAVRQLRDRVAALLPTKVAVALIDTHAHENGLTVQAFMAPPEMAQTTARGVQLFVGGRAIRDRGVLHAVTMGYGELVPRGRYPCAVVFVTAPDGTVDYNVHPQKSEVRFADANAVQTVVRHAIRAAIARSSWVAHTGAVSVSGLTAAAAMPAPAEAQGPATVAPRASALAFRYAQQLGKSGEWGPARGRDVPGAQLGLAVAPHRALGSPMQPDVSSAQGTGRLAGSRVGVVNVSGAQLGTGEDRAEAARAVQTSIVASVPAASVAEQRASSPVAPEPVSHHAQRDPGAARTWAQAVRRAATPLRETALPEGRAAAAAGMVTLRDSTSAHGWSRTAREEEGQAEAPAPRTPVVASEALRAESLHAESLRAESLHAESLRYLGQLDLSYLICESAGAMVLLDQHAIAVQVAVAEARVGPSPAVQPLLVPLRLGLAAEVGHAVAAHAPHLRAVGFSVDFHVASAELVVSAMPAVLPSHEVEHVMLAIVDQWIALPRSRAAAAAYCDAALVIIACHSVLKHGEPVTPRVATSLLARWQQLVVARADQARLAEAPVDMRAPSLGPVPHCRHAKVPMLQLSFDELARRFGNL